SLDARVSRFAQLDMSAPRSSGSRRLVSSGRSGLALPRSGTRALALRRGRAGGALLAAPNRTLVGGDGMHVGTPKEVPRRAVARMCTCVDGHGRGDYAMGLDDPFSPGACSAHLVGSSSSRTENSGVTMRECGYTR